MQWFQDDYTTNPQERQQFHLSPLRATTQQLAGLPPAFVQTAESEVLHDESEAYARQLEEAGVHVTAVRYNGMIHNWDLLSQLSGTRSVMFQAAELKAALK